MKSIFYEIANSLLNNRFVLRIIFRFMSEKKKEEMIIKSIRRNFILLGSDYTNITDVDIKKQIDNIGQTISCFGATPKEAAKALRIMNDTN